MSIGISIFKYMYLYEAEHEFIQMSPTLVHYHNTTVQSSTGLFVISSFDGEKPGSHHCHPFS